MGSVIKRQRVIGTMKIKQTIGLCKRNSEQIAFKYLCRHLFQANFLTYGHLVFGHIVKTVVTSQAANIAALTVTMKQSKTL